MQTQTYYHTRLQEEANRRNDTVPLQVNCTGVVSSERFLNRSVRRDYYYIYVMQGKMILGEMVLEPGDVLIYEPEQTYQYQNEGKTVYYWVHFTGSEADSLARDAVSVLNEKRYVGIRKEIEDCFKRLFREFIINDRTSAQLSECLLREILSLTARYTSEDLKENMPYRALEYIHGHFREELDIDELAVMEHMSQTMFRMVFKRHTGVSPNEYVISQRISEACRLLSQTEQSVRVIAAEVGYSDPYYFSRLFKKKVGITPLKYRKQTRV